MLLYSTLLIIALALAVGIIWIYRTTSDTSKAIYTTILPDTLESKPTDHLKQSEGQKPSRVVKDPWGQKQHATPANVAKTNVAVPEHKAPWGWRGNEHHTGGHHPAHGHGNARHCSLYDSPATDPTGRRGQKVGWPYREEIADSSGTAYKVSRKRVRVRKKPPSDPKVLSKPWGW